MTTENYFALSPGLLIKGFDNKKSVKNSLTIKFMLTKVLRKVLIVLNINFLNFIICGEPLKIQKHFMFFFQPISHVFTNPLINKNYNEVDYLSHRFFLKSLVFMKTVFFGKKKNVKKGRVKRKILRKLVKKNYVVD